MRLKTLVAVLILSLVCLVSRVSLADTLTLTATGGEASGYNYVYPYYFTITGPGGTNTLVTMGCLNYNRDVNFGETWDATVINVSTISPSATIDGESGLDILADAYLYNQFATAPDGFVISDIQYAMWSIMDPSLTPANTEGAMDANAQALASNALSVASTLPSSYFVNDNLFVPVVGSQPNGYGEPQLLITDPAPPASTPEPTSLILLGTGLLGAVAIMRRRHGKA